MRQEQPIGIIYFSKNYQLFSECYSSFLTEAEPWKMKGVDEIRRAAIVRTVCEAVYAFMHFLAPVTPLAAQTVFDRLHTNPVPLFQLKPTFYNLIPGTEIDVGNILFTKIVEDEVVEVVRPLTVSSANDDPNQTDVSKLEFKVCDKQLF